MRCYFPAFVAYLFCYSANAQSISPTVISPAGQSYQNGSVILEQTIGEPVTHTYTSGGNMLTQGFHQPLVSAVGLDDWQRIDVKLFPNPTIAFATVEVPEFLFESYVIYDAAGKIITENLLAGNSFIIDATNYSTGIYTIRLKGKIESLLTFIKH